MQSNVRELKNSWNYSKEMQWFPADLPWWSTVMKNRIKLPSNRICYSTADSKNTSQV